MQLSSFARFAPKLSLSFSPTDLEKRASSSLKRILPSSPPKQSGHVLSKKKGNDIIAATKLVAFIVT